MQLLKSQASACRNVYSFLSEVLNAQPTTSTVLAFDPDHRAAPAGPDPWWRSDDSLRAGRTVHCIDCGNPDPDRAANPELCRSDLPDPHWADRDFWPMNPHAPAAPNLRFGRSPNRRL